MGVAMEQNIQNIVYLIPFIFVCFIITNVSMNRRFDRLERKIDQNYRLLSEKIDIILMKTK